MEFAKRMEQANYSAFNKWKKLWVAGFQEKMHGPLSGSTTISNCFTIDPSTG